MDAAVYIYIEIERCMYNDYSIYNCTIPTNSIFLFTILVKLHVYSWGAKRKNKKVMEGILFGWRVVTDQLFNPSNVRHLQGCQDSTG